MTTQYLNDRYEILQQLGKRTGRETLLARDLSTEKLVVIKLLKFNSEFEWDDLKLFEREAQILQELSHPAIPQYLDSFEFEVPQYKGFALVQTYIEAKSLEQHRQAGRTFTEDEVKQIAEQLLEILSYLHDRHPPVIHRDLKPSNILLGDRSAHSVGKIYLVDFGSVQNVAATEGGTFTVVGTYGYMPPEQFGGRTVPASDLYSLGATLIYLLTGRHPADLPQKNLQIDIAKVAKLSPGLERWLGKLLEPSLDQRFSSAQDALKVLQTPETNTILSERDEKPVGSKISISRNSEVLTISLPRCKLVFESGESRNVRLTSLLKSEEIAVVLRSLFAILLLLLFIFSTLLLIPFLTACVIVSCVLNQYRDELIKIKITKEKIEIISKSLEIENSFSTTHIKKIAKTSCFITRKKVVGSYEDRKIEPSIVIWLGTSQYKIKDLTEPEADWLGAELSDWLGLPLTRRDIPIISL